MLSAFGQFNQWGGGGGGGSTSKVGVHMYVNKGEGGTITRGGSITRGGGGAPFTPGDAHACSPMF